jgi:hypothetical protein
MLMEKESAMLETGRVCKVNPSVCLSGLKAISDMNNTVNNVKRLPVIMSHFPSGTSTKNLLHFQQFVRKE